MIVDRAPPTPVPSPTPRTLGMSDRMRRASPGAAMVSCRSGCTGRSATRSPRRWSPAARAPACGRRRRAGNPAGRPGTGIRPRCPSSAWPCEQTTGSLSTYTTRASGAIACAISCTQFCVGRPTPRSRNWRMPASPARKDAPALQSAFLTCLHPWWPGGARRPAASYPGEMATSAEMTARGSLDLRGSTRRLRRHPAGR